MADIKWSQFPSATPSNSDEVVGLHAGGNARFSIANIVAAVRNGLANIFVPKTDVGAAGGIASLDSNGKVPSSQLPSSTGPEPATATPLMDRTGAVGTSTKYAREDHEHPADTNKQNAITASGILKGDGAGGVTAATAGTDYATPAQLADKANQSQLAYVETGTTASRDYLWDDFFWMGGILYRTTNRVNNGTPFTVRTNCEAVLSGGFNKMAMRLLGATVGSETIQPPSYQCLVLATRNTGAFLGILYTITTTTWYLIKIQNGISGISLDTSTGAITFPSYTQYVYFW